MQRIPKENCWLRVFSQRTRGHHGNSDHENEENSESFFEGNDDGEAGDGDDGRLEYMVP